MTTNKDKTYWRIMERYVRLHPKLNVRIFGKNKKIAVIFYETNNDQEIIAYGESEHLGTAINLANKSYPLNTALNANHYQADIPKENNLEINSYESLEEAIRNQNCIISILNEQHGINDKLVEMNVGDKNQCIRFSSDSELLTLIIQASHFYNPSH